MWDTGSSGSVADFATRTAKSRFFWNSAWTSASSSGKTKPQPSQPSSSSGVQARVFLSACAQSVNSPLVVYRSAETPGLKPATAGSVSLPVRAT
jgi:hypothetical protein